MQKPCIFFSHSAIQELRMNSDILDFDADYEVSSRDSDGCGEAMSPEERQISD